jgi:hypothetical protein
MIRKAKPKAKADESPTAPESEPVVAPKSEGTGGLPSVDGGSTEGIPARPERTPAVVTPRNPTPTPPRRAERTVPPARHSPPPAKPVRERESKPTESKPFLKEKVSRSFWELWFK